MSKKSSGFPVFVAGLDVSLQKSVPANYKTAPPDTPRPGALPSAAQGGNVDDRYRITPVTYTTAIYYFMYRFLSGLCRHHQVGAGLHRAGVGRGEECACPAVQRLINSDEYLLSGTSQVAVSDQ